MLLQVENRTKNYLLVSGENFGGLLVHDSVVEEVALITSAWEFWWIVLAATPSGYSTGLCWQTGRAREQKVVLLQGASPASAGPGIRDFSHPPAFFLSMVRGTTFSRIHWCYFRLIGYITGKIDVQLFCICSLLWHVEVHLSRRAWNGVVPFRCPGGLGMRIVETIPRSKGDVFCWKRRVGMPQRCILRYQ